MPPRAMRARCGNDRYCKCSVTLHVQIVVYRSVNIHQCRGRPPGRPGDFVTQNHIAAGNHIYFPSENLKIVSIFSGPSRAPAPTWIFETSTINYNLNLSTKNTRGFRHGYWFWDVNPLLLPQRRTEWVGSHDCSRTGHELAAAASPLTCRRAPWPGRGGRPLPGSSAAPRDPRCRQSRRRSCR